MQKTNISAAETADFEARSLDAICVNDEHVALPWWHNLKYTAAGLIFGIILVKSEVVSWFRIQEMFRFQSFHMYGVIGTAVAVGALSVFLIKKWKIRTIHGEEVVFHDKKFDWGVVFGSLVFGLGWAITGACPGPIYAQIGGGFLAVGVTLVSAIAGTWTYGFLREKLPH